MRAAAVRLHRYVGLAMAGYLVIAGLTGSAITYRHEIDRWLNPDILVGQQVTQRLSLPTLLESVAAYAPDAKPVMVAFGPYPDDAIAIHLRPQEGGGLNRAYTALYVDPVSANVLGARDAERSGLDRRRIMHFLYVLHYSLHGGGIMRIFLGLVAVVWTLDCFVGFYLTLPRGQLFWRKWLPAWKLKRNAGRYRLNLDLHRAGGLWLWLLLFAVASSGAYLNLRSIVFDPLIDAVSPLPRSPLATRDIPASDTRHDVGFAAAFTIAEQHAARAHWPGAPQFIWHGAEQRLYHIRFDHGGTWSGPSDVYVDAESGALLQERAFAANGTIETFRQVQLPLHSGRVAGSIGRILICITGLMTAMLSITGVIIWWRKRIPRVARRRAIKAAKRTPIAIGEAHAAE